MKRLIVLIIALLGFAFTGFSQERATDEKEFFEIDVGSYDAVADNSFSIILPESNSTTEIPSTAFYVPGYSSGKGTDVWILDENSYKLKDFSLDKNLMLKPDKDNSYLLQLKITSTSDLNKILSLLEQLE